MVDDTSQARAGRKVEGTSSYFDHTEGRTRHGHQALQLGLALEKGFLPLGAQLFNGVAEAPVLVLAEKLSDTDERSLTGAGVEVERFAGGLNAALRLLAVRGLLDILLEGGPTMAAALLAAGLVDRVALFVTPLLVGRGAPDVLALPAVASLQDAPRLTHQRWQTAGQDMLLHADLEVA